MSIQESLNLYSNMRYYAIDYGKHEVVKSYSFLGFIVQEIIKLDLDVVCFSGEYEVGWQIFKQGTIRLKSLRIDKFEELINFFCQNF